MCSLWILDFYLFTYRFSKMEACCHPSSHECWTSLYSLEGKSLSKTDSRQPGNKAAAIKILGQILWFDILKQRCWPLARDGVDGIHKSVKVSWGSDYMTFKVPIIFDILNSSYTYLSAFFFFFWLFQSCPRLWAIHPTLREWAVGHVGSDTQQWWELSYRQVRNNPLLWFPLGIFFGGGGIWDCLFYSWLALQSQKKVGYDLWGTPKTVMLCTFSEERNPAESEPWGEAMWHTKFAKTAANSHANSVVITDWLGQILLWTF